MHEMDVGRWSCLRFVHVVTSYRRPERTTIGEPLLFSVRSLGLRVATNLYLVPCVAHITLSTRFTSLRIINPYQTTSKGLLLFAE